MDRAAARDVAEQLFGQSPERRLQLLRAAWPKAVGPELARRTEVVALDGNALRIRVADASWRKGLLRMRRDILSRLYGVAGRLAPNGLGFVEGGLAGASEPKAPPPTRVPPVRASGFLAAEAARIDDAELRERFLESAALYLDRFKPVS
jgi:Dna[CI] antecedent DciA-like protein